MKNIAKPTYRLIAGTIDFLLPSLWFAYSLYNLSFSNSVEMFLNNFWPIIYWLILQSVALVLLNSFLTAKFGGSLGKLLVGLEVVDLTKKRLTFNTSFLREIFKISISSMFIFLGNLWLFVDKSHQAWQDMVVDSYVVTVSNKRQILGIIVSIVLLLVYIFLIKFSVDNFRLNSLFYVEVFSDLIK